MSNPRVRFALAIAFAFGGLWGCGGPTPIPSADPARDGGAPRDSVRPPEEEAIPLPQRNAAQEVQRATERQAKLAERKAPEEQVVEALKKTAAAKEARGAELAAILSAQPVSLTDVAVSPDARLVLFCGLLQKGVQAWDLRTGQVKVGFAAPCPVQAVAFSPDGQTVAAGCDDATVRLYDASTGALKLTLPGHAHEVKAVAFFADGRRLASGSASDFDGATGSLFFWQMPGGESVLRWWHKGGVDGLALRPDGTALAEMGLLTRLKLSEVATGKPYKITFDGVKEVEGMAFSPDGWTLAVVGYEEGLQSRQVLRLYDLVTGQSRELKGAKEEKPGRYVAFTPDGKALLTSSGSSLCVWDVEKGSLRREYGFIDVGKFVITPGGQMLVSVKGGGDVSVYHLPTLLEGEPK